MRDFGHVPRFVERGDHIVASPDVYGGTYGLLNSELTRFGGEVALADMRDPASYEAAIQPGALRRTLAQRAQGLRRFRPLVEVASATLLVAQASPAAPGLQSGRCRS